MGRCSWLSATQLSTAQHLRRQRWAQHLLDWKARLAGALEHASAKALHHGGRTEHLRLTPDLRAHADNELSRRDEQQGQMPTQASRCVGPRGTRGTAKAHLGIHLTARSGRLLATRVAHLGEGLAAFLVERHREHPAALALVYPQQAASKRIRTSSVSRKRTRMAALQSAKRPETTSPGALLI
jgi:hypothetical protein